jgi:hypothetical protein
MANCEINFFDYIIHRFSLVKAAMNAPRICKMRNGFNKTPQFFNPSAIFLIQVRNGYSPQPSKLLYNCQFKNKDAL